MMFMRADAQLPSRLRQTGLSLVELGVAMAIVGVIGIITWRWVADTRAPMAVSYTHLTLPTSDLV